MKKIFIIIGLVILIMSISQNNNKKEIDNIKLAESSINLGANQIIKVDAFPKAAIYSITESSILQATVPGPGGDWCYDSSCDCQCTGSFDFCDNWLNKQSPCSSNQEIKTCPSGTIDIGNDRCCPSSYPNYCSSDTLCYVDTNCGKGTLKEVKCKTLNSIDDCGRTFYNLGGICGGSEIKTTLYENNIYPNFGACYSSKGLDWCSSCANDWQGNNEDGLRACNMYGQMWNDLYITEELNNQFIFSGCDSCSGDLCVLSDRCQAGEIRCADSTHYYSCSNIKPTYFANSFNAFTKIINTCPSGNICSNNKCVPDLSGVCGDVKQGILASISEWANSPTLESKSQILSRITEWTGVC